MTSLSFWEFWTRPGKGERRKGKGKNFDPDKVSVFISQKKLLLVTQCSSQVDQRAAETGVEGAAGRALRPWLPPPLPPWWSPCLHEGGLDRAYQEVADILWSIKRTRPQNCCKEAKTILEEEEVSTAIKNAAVGVMGRTSQIENGLLWSKGFCWHVSTVYLMFLFLFRMLLLPKFGGVSKIHVFNIEQVQSLVMLSL